MYAHSSRALAGKRGSFLFAADFSFDAIFRRQYDYGTGRPKNGSF
jgi:hypothetical protein